MTQTSEQRLEDIYTQLDELKDDVNAPDRGRVMRRLRKERRKLEKQLGKEPRNGNSKTPNGRKTTKKAVEKATGIPDSPMKTAKKERRKRKRESVSSKKELTVADASEQFLDVPPETFFEWLIGNGYIDRRNDREAQKQLLFCIPIERKNVDKDPEYLIQKFEERWGQKPEFFTTLHQGRFEMLAFAPVPSQFNS